MAIYTNLHGITKAKVPRTARNNHLVPEVSTVIKRTLTGAAQEMNKAISAVNTLCEYYSILTSGRRCSCTLDKDPTLNKEVEDTLNLQDFILGIQSQLPSTQEFCPICFGNKYVGGYKRSGCDTLVLDASLSHRLDKLNLVKELPYWFKPKNTLGRVTWKVQIPAYAEDVLNIAIRWKEEPAYWKFTIDDEKVTKQAILDRIGTLATFQMQIKDSSTEHAGLYAVFLQLQLNSKHLIQCDMPRITTSYTGPMNIVDESQDTITINFDNSVSPTTRDVVVTQDGRIYRITEVERGDPAGISIFSTCQARLVRNFERYYTLPSKVLLNTFPDLNYTFLE